MNLKDILAISGEAGLFRYVAQGRNAIIVENLDTGKKTSVHGSAKVNSLVDISIFTENEDIPLSVVFDKIFEKENGGIAIDPKSSSEELKKYFGEVLPDYNRERVFVSDIKKVFTWYKKLHELNLLIKDEPEAKTVEDNTVVEEIKIEETGKTKSSKVSKKQK
jgi:hypothetical protein